jgi:hypothetical protein
MNKFINRDFSTELTAAILNGIGNQVQEILFELFNDRNQTIDEILKLSHRTWNTLDQLTLEFKEKIINIAPIKAIGDEWNMLVKYIDNLIVETDVIMEDEHCSFQLKSGLY